MAQHNLHNLHTSLFLILFDLQVFIKYGYRAKEKERVRMRKQGKVNAIVPRILGVMIFFYRAHALLGIYLYILFNFFFWFL